MEFKAITDLQQLDAYRDWDRTLPNEKTLVNSKGQKVSNVGGGITYRLIGDYEQKYPLIERIARAVLGAFAVLATLGAGLKSEAIMRLFSPTRQAVRIGILEKQEPAKVKLKSEYHHIQLDGTGKVEVTKTNKLGNRVIKKYTLDRKMGKGNYGKAFAIKPQCGQGKEKVLKIAKESCILEASAAMLKGKTFLDKQFVHPLTGQPFGKVPGILNVKHVNALKGLGLSKLCSGSMLPMITKKHSFEFYSRYLTQTAFAVNHLHQETPFKPGLIHHDLKPENILYLETNGHCDFTIIDFDGSHESDAPTGFGYTKGYTSEKDIATWKLNSKNKKLNAAMDVYSLGISWAEVLVGRQFSQEQNPPVLTKEFIKEAVMSRGVWPAKEKEQLTQMCGLIATMTDQDWTKRPTINACVEKLKSIGLEMPNY